MSPPPPTHPPACWAGSLLVEARDDKAALKHGTEYVRAHQDDA